MISRRAFCLAALCAGAWLLPAPVRAVEDFAIIPLRHRPVDEVLPAARALLGERGVVVPDAAGNALVVHAGAGDLERLRRLVAAMDQKAPTITVEARLLEGRGGGNLQVGAAGPGIGIPVGSGKGVRTRRFMVRLRSGESAYLRVARDIPWGPTWEVLCRENRVAVARGQARRVLESGLSVRARTLPEGDILVDMAPRFTTLDGQEVEVVSAAASLVLRPGAWTLLAASTQRTQQQAWALVLGQNSAAAGSGSRRRREWALLVRAFSGSWGVPEERPEVRSLPSPLAPRQ